MNFIDLFAGAGGLSEGFLKEGYNCVGHIEMMPEACETLKTREAFYYLKKTNRLDLYNSYISGNMNREAFLKEIPCHVLDKVICKAMSSDNLEALFQTIDNNKNGQSIDVIIGGPPCQAYSLIGRARTDMTNDPRNHLYLLYLRSLRNYMPKVFVFENVRGILSAGDGQYFADLKKKGYDIGYHVDDRLVRAEEYGVIQHRRREIILGIRNDDYKEEIGFPFPESRDVEFRNFIVQDLFSDLPALLPGETNNKYAGGPNEYLKISGIREEGENVLTWHTTRPINEHDRAIYRFVIRYNLMYGRNPKYTEIPSELQSHKNKKNFLDRFKMVQPNAHTSQTMVAHISKDGHYFIYPDEQQARSLSVREAARIQSFPDNYFFEGSRTSAFMQIGNAVPPLLSLAIAKSIKEFLEQ